MLQRVCWMTFQELTLHQSKSLSVSRLKIRLWKRQPTHSLWRSAFPHQGYIDTFYVLPTRRRRPKLVLTGTSIPLVTFTYIRLIIKITISSNLIGP